MSRSLHLISSNAPVSLASFRSRGCGVSSWRIIVPAILFFAFCCLPASVYGQAAITVDVATGSDTVNPLLFGQNVLFANGMWDTRTNDLHTGAAPLVRNLAPWVLRFPGGSQSDLYFWEDGIGLKTTTTVSAGASSIGLESVPNWGTVSSGRFIDAAQGQFGDTFTFTSLNGTQLQGVSGVSVSHLAGVEVRPEPRQGQPSSFSNQYGIDEHMRLATSMGAEAVLTLNYGTGLDRTGAVTTATSLSQRVKRAAAWVAYLNGTPTDAHPLGVDAEGTDWQTVGYWAQKRAQRGHAAPYGVHYWEIGNEVYGNWEAGFTTARQYATDVLVFVSALKAIDPTIEVGAVGRAEPHRKGDADSVEEWNATVVQVAGDVIDFLSVHPYYPAAGLSQVQNSYTSPIWFTAVMAGAQQALKDLQEVRAIITANSTRAGQIGLAVTEYGLWPADSSSATDFSNLARALYDADLLMTLIQQGTSLDVILATVWNLHGSNAAAAISYDWSTGKRVIRPQYYSLQLLNDLAPQLHNTTVTTPTFSTAQVGNVAAATSLPMLTAVAGTDGTGQLTLFVLNRALSSALTTSISLLGYSPQTTATVRTLAADSLAANNETNPLTVVPLTTSLSSVATTFSYTFPAHSLTVIEFQPDSQPAPPLAVIKVPAVQGKAPFTVKFDGSASKATGNAQIVRYNWSFGDGSQATGVSVTHVYTKPGTYKASLSVTDSTGLTGTATTTITVTKAKGK